MDEVFANFKKYNEKGQRMNIFAVVHDNDIIITYFPCSKKDQFCKEIGWELWELYFDDTMGIEEMKLVSNAVIPIVDGKPKKTFLNWCNENFLQPQDTIDWRSHYVKYLKTNEGKLIILADRPIVKKLSMRN
jgi:hypothetical protein